MKILLSVFVFFLLIVLQRKVYQHIWKKHLGVTVSFVTPFAVAGERTELEEVIENKKWFPLPVLRVKFSLNRGLVFEENVTRSDRLYKNDIFSVMPYMRITRKHSFLCEQRGLYTVDSLGLSSSDLLMSKTFVETVPEHAKLTVYPSKADMKRLLPVFSQMMGQRQMKALLSDPFSFAGIREYAPTDPMKNINWKATAKTGELKVNTYDSTRALETRILLDLGSDTEWIDNGVREEAIRIAGTLFSLFVEKGVVCSLYTNGKDVVSAETSSVSGGATAAHVRMAKEVLARIDLKKEWIPAESLTEQLGKDKDVQYVVITSCENTVSLCHDSGAEGVTAFYLHRPDSDKMTETEGISLVNWEVRYG